MGDSLPWMPMNRLAKFDAASFILGGEIRNRTYKQTIDSSVALRHAVAGLWSSVRLDVTCRSQQQLDEDDGLCCFRSSAAVTLYCFSTCLAIWMRCLACYVTSVPHSEHNYIIAIDKKRNETRFTARRQPRATVGDCRRSKGRIEMANAMSRFDRCIYQHARSCYCSDSLQVYLDVCRIFVRINLLE